MHIVPSVGATFRYSYRLSHTKSIRDSSKLPAIHLKMSTTTYPLVTSTVEPALTTCPNEAWKIALAVFAGFVGAMLITVLVWLLYYKPKRWQKKGADAEKYSKEELQKELATLRNENLLRHHCRP